MRQKPILLVPVFFYVFLLSATFISCRSLRHIGYENGHQYVDLGLSVKWATCNIGASKYNTVSYGVFFAWGETETRYAFDKNYYLEPKQGHYYDGNLSVLEPSDDAATVLWGKEWRLPTKEEWLYAAKEGCRKSLSLQHQGAGARGELSVFSLQGVGNPYLWAKAQRKR